ncbi:MAG: hypothetical protein ACFE8E_11780 [Candidatus Hodarchaeota archaeon]
MDFALMFQVLEGGVSEPVKWNADNLSSDKNILILDEGSSSIYLWHGSKQGLVARRTALRQAESLKGHGYVAGKSIIGRDIKFLKEIDQRKIGRDIETDKFNEELQNILNREFKELDNYIITFDVEGAKEIPIKPISKPVPKPTPIESETKPYVEPLPKSKVIAPIPVEQPTPKISKPAIEPASEYNSKIEDTVKTELPSVSEPVVKEEKKLDLDVQAKIGFVLIAILDHYDDVWISQKEDGSYGVEMMDGPICQFSIKDGSKIAFTANSFAGIATNVKIEIQKKFVELSKLLK